MNGDMIYTLLMAIVLVGFGVCAYKLVCKVTNSESAEDLLKLILSYLIFWK